MSVSASVRVSQSKGFNRASSDPQGRHGHTRILRRDWLDKPWLGEFDDVTASFSPSLSNSKGLEGTERPLPVRKARPSSSGHFFSTKRGGRTRQLASRTPAQTPPGTDASEETGKKTAFIRQECFKVVFVFFFLMKMLSFLHTHLWCIPLVECGPLLVAAYSAPCGSQSALHRDKSAGTEDINMSSHSPYTQLGLMVINTILKNQSLSLSFHVTACLLNETL